MTTGKKGEIGCKLVLLTNMESHTGCRLVSKSVTLDDFQQVMIADARYLCSRWASCHSSKDNQTFNIL